MNRIPPTIQDIKDLQNGLYNPNHITPQIVKCIKCGLVINLSDKSKHCNCFKKYKLYIENE